MTETAAIHSAKNRPRRQDLFKNTLQFEVYQGQPRELVVAAEQQKYVSDSIDGPYIKVHASVDSDCVSARLISNRCLTIGTESVTDQLGNDQFHCL